MPRSDATALYNVLTASSESFGIILVSLSWLFSSVKVILLDIDDFIVTNLMSYNLDSKLPLPHFLTTTPIYYFIRSINLKTLNLINGIKGFFTLYNEDLLNKPPPYIVDITIRYRGLAGVHRISRVNRNKK